MENRSPLPRANRQGAEEVVHAQDGDNERKGSSAQSQHLSLPTRKRGRQTPAATAAYEAALVEFCAMLRQIQSAVDFKMSARGWAYNLENDGIITKGQIDAAQDLINTCRKNGLLPLDFTAADKGRECIGLEEIDATSPEEEAGNIVERVGWAHELYVPFSFWRDQDHYVEMLVEKIDLLQLFAPVCEHFRVPIANASGWVDINTRGEMMQRFKRWERAGKQCVLLVCTDLDPAGLRIAAFVRSNLEEISKATGWTPDKLIIDRFGLNADFISEHKLTWIEGLETSGKKKKQDAPRRLDDPRHPDHDKAYVQSYLRQYGARKVEANALVVRPQAGRDLCRRAIRKYINEDAAAEYHRLIEIEQEKVRRIVIEMMAEGAA